jgi:hypothetical protein
VRCSQSRLCSRVKEALGETIEPDISSEGMAEILARVDKMLEINPTDTRHMFWE